MPSPSLSLWPAIGLAAKNNHRLTAWRAWELARHYDRAGSGVVEHADLLRFYTLNLNLSLSTGRNYIQCAVNAGFFMPLTRRNGSKWYLLRGAVGVALSLGLSSVETKRVSVPVKDLTGKGWRKVLWTAKIAACQERPISRAKLEELTHIPAKSQRSYESKTGVTTTPIYIHDENTPVSSLNYLRYDHPDYPKPHAFPRYDANLNRAIIVYRAPDKRHAPASYSQSRGRSKKVNHALKLLSFSGQERHTRVSLTPVKLFHHKDKSLRQAQKRLVKQQIPDSGKDSVQTLYIEKPGGRGCLQYNPYPVASLPLGSP